MRIIPKLIGQTAYRWRNETYLRLLYKGDATRKFFSKNGLNDARLKSKSETIGEDIPDAVQAHRGSEVVSDNVGVELPYEGS